MSSFHLSVLWSLAAPESLMPSIFGLTYIRKSIFHSIICTIDEIMSDSKRNKLVKLDPHDAQEDSPSYKSSIQLVDDNAALSPPACRNLCLTTYPLTARLSSRISR